jgi:hypothetical protein
MPRYHYCDFPMDDTGGKCGKPARLMPHGGLSRCEPHAARLPYWPTDSEPVPEEAPPQAAQGVKT